MNLPKRLIRNSDSSHCSTAFCAVCNEHLYATMGGNYREWIEPERLQAVTELVRKWVKPMFRKPAKKEAAK